jgi:hypothetical protein
MTPSFELNLLYANLAVMLSPNPVSLPKIPPTRGSDAWVGRVKAVESAWQEMRAVNEKSMGQGRNKENTAIWALNEVAEWIVSTLVSSLAGFYVKIWLTRTGSLPIKMLSRKH